MTTRTFPRKLSVLLLSVAVVIPVAASWARQGPAQRAGQALDNAGKNIRRGVENAVTRVEVSTLERDLLARVYHRIHWDKMLVTSPLEILVQVDGTAILRGSVVDVAAKKRAVDLALSTVGVTKVVDELVIAKNVIVVPAAKPVIVVPATPPVVVEPKPPTVIIKP